MDEGLLANISSDEDENFNQNVDQINVIIENEPNTRLSTNVPAKEYEPAPTYNENINAISSDESEIDKAHNISPSIVESKKWQQITAADFDEIRELSDTDDEFNSSNLTVANTKYWSQSVVPTKYYVRNGTGGHIGTSSLHNVQEEFESRVLNRIKEIQDAQQKSEPPKNLQFHSCSSCNHNEIESESSEEDENKSSDDNSESGSSNCGTSRQTKRTNQNKQFSKNVFKDKPTKQSLMAKNEIERKQNHPAGLHPDICFNEPGQLNDGPFCKCSWASKQTGVRHNKFAGESPIPKCYLNESNIERLYHYVLQITPNPNKFTRNPTVIDVDGIKYVFDGFSVFFHQPLPETFPQSPMNQWNSDFVVKFEKENSPESFTVKDLELFHTYLFDDIMEMLDLDRMPNAKGDSCLFYHCMPRFVRFLKDDGKEILSMSSVLKHFTDCFIPFANDATALNFCKNSDLLIDAAQSRKGRLFLNPVKKPMCLRVDLIDRHDLKAGHNDFYPLFTHFGIRPSAYTYNGKPEYQRALKRFIKLRHLFSLKARPNSEDRQKLRDSEDKLKRLRTECKTKRDISVCISSRGFFETGIYPDLVQHAMFLILACLHARFHWSLKVYEEERIKYKFKNRVLLELALTHPSYRSNYGTNPDHAKNTLNNCGIIQTKVRGAKSESYLSADLKSGGNGRKRGITALMEIMSMQGSKKAVKTSSVNHNERLEFLGDAVVEFITTVHLFFMFPDADEGVLATYRSALVQNKHLAALAKKIGLHEFMLYAHGPDLCHEADLRHAMANAFEAMMAAVFLDSNINECDRIFSETLYSDEKELLYIWSALPDHELKTGNPFGDRHKIEEIECLKHLIKFEDQIGVKFKYIRVLAKALTRRNIDFNYLTFGHNQRLEFLGDTVLQLITTDYLYKHFPEHQEGHLSLLRTCLVSNKTQSVICDDLAMQKYLVITKKAERSGKTSSQLRMKDKADLVESFLGALYVDRGLQYCKIFCRVCFFPRLKYFILTQRWNDPKSQLQQCCLTLRQAESGEPDIPEYKTIGVEGPTNTRVYRVAVYFRNKRLAEGVGSSVQLAQMQAAECALIEKAELFPSFDFRNTYLSVRNGETINEELVKSTKLSNNISLKNRKRKRPNSFERNGLNLINKRSKILPRQQTYGNQRIEGNTSNYSFCPNRNNSGITSQNQQRNNYSTSSSIESRYKKLQNEKFVGKTQSYSNLSHNSKYETNSRFNKFSSDITINQNQSETDGSTSFGNSYRFSSTTSNQFKNDYRNFPTSRFTQKTSEPNVKSEFYVNDSTKVSYSAAYRPPPHTSASNNAAFNSYFNGNTLDTFSANAMYGSNEQTSQKFKHPFQANSTTQPPSSFTARCPSFQKQPFKPRCYFPCLSSTGVLPAASAFQPLPQRDGYCGGEMPPKNNLQHCFNTPPPPLPTSLSSFSNKKVDEKTKARITNNNDRGDGAEIEAPVRFF